MVLCEEGVAKRAAGVVGTLAQFLCVRKRARPVQNRSLTAAQHKRRGVVEAARGENQRKVRPRNSPYPNLCSLFMRAHDGIYERTKRQNIDHGDFGMCVRACALMLYIYYMIRTEPFFGILISGNVLRGNWTYRLCYTVDLFYTHVCCVCVCAWEYGHKERIFQHSAVYIRIACITRVLSKLLCMRVDTEMRRSGTT